jgi:nucleoside-diphosphate-sugar epimerase
MDTILITGATGFLGSHIAEELINKGYKVVALKRSTSSLWKCDSFKNRIRWIDCDNWIEAEAEVIKQDPKILIHTAWNGVKASDRDDWEMQEKNLAFFVSLLETVKQTKISKIISLGSQAEYGIFEGSVSEDYPCNPSTAYGANKLCASVLLRSFAEQNKIDWYWIRIFSVFGPREDKNWLIPAAINNLLERKPMALTSCEQRYDYLFVKDFATGILSVVKNNKRNPGIYNMSSGTTIQLKSILSFLEENLAAKQQLLQIGALPLRTGQVMHMEGNSDRFFRLFNYKPTYSIYAGLEETINYYKDSKNNG